METKITRDEWLQQIEWLKGTYKHSNLVFDTEVGMPSHADDLLTHRRTINPAYKAFMERTYRWHCRSCESDEGEAFWCSEDNPTCCIHPAPQSKEGDTDGA